jgi:hypothetical protein
MCKNFFLIFFLYHLVIVLLLEIEEDKDNLSFFQELELNLEKAHAFNRQLINR